MKSELFHALSPALGEHDMHQVDGVFGAELFDHTGAMNLDGARTETKVAAGFLAGGPGGDKLEHLIFPAASANRDPEIGQ
jgi:hypothetical protein